MFILNNNDHIQFKDKRRILPVLICNFFAGDQCTIIEGRAPESVETKFISLDLADTSEECIDMVKKYPDAVGMYWVSPCYDTKFEKTCYAIYETFEPQDIDESQLGPYYICKF